MTPEPNRREAPMSTSPSQFSAPVQAVAAALQKLEKLHNVAQQMRAVRRGERTAA